MALSSLLDRFNEPETLKMAKLGRQLRSEGIDIVDLSLGEPDFDTPQHIKDAAIRAINDNFSHYTPVSGFLDLKEAVCQKLKRDNALDYKPENIVVSTGAKQSIANVVLALVDRGDEVIIPTPYWVTYSALVQLAEGEVVYVETDIENGYKISPQQLEDAITEKTKLFMFSSPNNPSGAVYSKAELAGLAAVFARYPQVYILSDEIYEFINYVGAHESIAQFEELKNRVIVVNGLSKGFAMTGWRLGYIAAPADVAKAAEKLQGQFTSGTNSIAQRAAITALTSPLDTTYAMVKEFERRRKRVVEFVCDIEGFKCTTPDGAFYVFPDVSSFFGTTDGETTIENSTDLCMYLIHKAHVSTVSGSAFGSPQSIRISFANSMENIEKGFARIIEALKKLEAPGPKGS
jgi:aspartate aminotransferase